MNQNKDNVSKNKITLKDIKKNISDIFTWDYYKEGFSNWSIQSRIWWIFGLIVIISTGISNNMSEITFLSILGGALGFTTTLAITNNKRLNGVLGFISAGIIGYLAIISGNPADAFMQLAYLLVLDIPVILFGNEWNKEKIKTKMNFEGYKIMISVFVLGFIIMFILDKNILNTERPFIDSISAAAGFTGAALMLSKYSSQYIWWAIQGILSVTLWGITAYQGSANWVLFYVYILYIGNDILGLFFSEWSYGKEKK